MDGELTLFQRIYRKLKQIFCKHKWVYSYWQYKHYETRLVCIRCGIFAENIRVK